MICITNASTDRLALIVHCAHEHIASFRNASGMQNKVFAVYPVVDMRYSDTPTHYAMEPSALRLFEEWAAYSGFSVNHA